MNTITLVIYILTAVTAILWFTDLLVLRPQRKAELKNVEGSREVPLTKEEKEEILNPGGFFYSLASCFPVLLVVLVIRTFAYEKNVHNPCPCVRHAVRMGPGFPRRHAEGDR